MIIKAHPAAKERPMQIIPEIPTSSRQWTGLQDPRMKMM